MRRWVSTLPLPSRKRALAVGTDTPAHSMGVTRPLRLSSTRFRPLDVRIGIVLHIEPQYAIEIRRRTYPFETFKSRSTPESKQLDIASMDAEDIPNRVAVFRQPCSTRAIRTARSRASSRLKR